MQQRFSVYLAARFDYTQLHIHHSLLRHMRRHKSKKYERQVHNKTYKNRELQNRQQENIIYCNIHTTKKTKKKTKKCARFPHDAHWYCW